MGNILEIQEQEGCADLPVALSGLTIPDTQALTTCSEITADTTTVTATGDLTLTAGTRIAFGSGFAVETGGRLVASTDATGQGQTLTRTYSYQDFHYFLDTATGPWGTLAWSYDRIGNRLTETTNGATDTYSYLQNAATGNTALLTQIQLGAGGTKDYTHGPAGHLTQVAAGANVIDFTSDAEGRLSQLDRLAEQAPFAYDGRSYLRTATDTPTGDLTEPTYDSAGLLHALRRVNGGAEERITYLHFAGRPAAQLKTDGASSTLTWLTADHLGTPVLATDDAGAEVWDANYEPFGRDLDEGLPGGALANEMYLRFPGQWDDGRWGAADLGAEVFYNVHRWYSPATATYTRSDPLAPVNTSISFAGPSASGVLSPEAIYGYAQMSPLLRIDPLGLKSRVCCRKIPWLPASHCFIEIEQEGKNTTCGLHGGRFSTGEEAGVGQIRGPNSFDDKDESSCGPWNEECGTDECVIKTASDYANPSVYGAVRKSNSNSFAGHIARTCGLARPEGVARPVGWNRPPADPKPGREQVKPPCKLPGGNQ